MDFKKVIMNWAPRERQTSLKQKRETKYQDSVLPTEYKGPRSDCQK